MKVAVNAPISPRTTNETEEMSFTAGKFIRHVPVKAGLYRSRSVSLFHTRFQEFYYMLVRRNVLKFGLKLSNKTTTEQL